MKSAQSSGPNLREKLVQGILRRKIRVISVIVLILLINVFSAVIMQEVAKTEQKKLELSFNETISKYSEDLSRQELYLNNSRKTAITKTVSQFVMTISYDVAELNKTLYEYGPENLSDGNLAAKSAAAKKFALQFNELASHIGGMEYYLNEIAPQINLYAGSSTNVSEGLNKVSQGKTVYESIAKIIYEELSEFAQARSSRQAVASEALSLLKEIG